MNTSKNDFSHEIWLLDECPVTGAKIHHRPEWTDLTFGQDDYRVTISVIGDNIVHAKSWGFSRLAALEETTKLHEEIRKEFFTDKYFLIEDISESTGSTIPAKNYYTKYINDTVKNRYALIFMNPNHLITLLIKFARQIYRHKNNGLIAKDYCAAQELVSKILASDTEFPLSNDENTQMKTKYTQPEIDILVDDIITYAANLDWNHPEIAPAIVDESNPFKPIYDAIDLIRTDFSMIIQDKDKMQKQITQAAKLVSVGELAAGVGHEINNPLAAISGYGDIIQKELSESAYSDDFVSTCFEKQRRATERISNVVSGLRTYARDDTKVLVDFDPHEAISETCRLVGSIFEKRGIILKTEFDEVSSMIRGIRSRFQIVLMNLLNNSKDSMPNGGELSIKTSVQGDVISVSIADTGEGIETENINKIFDGFFTTKTAGSGAGLGLSISHSIVEELMGSIQLVSSSEEGTTFDLTFPTTTKALYESVSTSPELKHLESDGKILVVDDEEDLCNLIVSALSQNRISANGAENGLVALEIIKVRRFEYILLDIRMPILDGLSFLRVAQEANLLSETKVIIMTAFTEDLTPEAALLEEIDHVIIRKPFDIDDVIEIMKGSKT